MYCPQCGARNSADARFCENCGAPMDPAERHLLARETGAYTDRPANVADYGGFWRRAGAALVDVVILVTVLTVLQWLFAPGTMGPGQHGGQGGEHGMPADPVTGWTWWHTLEAIAAWLYWAGMHSSAWQATLGKMALGMQVTDLQGQRISFLRATARYLAEILSALLLMIGYIMVAFHPRKQGLHDLIAGTLVVRPRG